MSTQSSVSGGQGNQVPPVLDPAASGVVPPTDVKPPQPAAKQPLKPADVKPPQR